MGAYNLIDGYDGAGGDIVLSPSWAHKESEIRFLAAAEDEDRALVKVLSTTNYTKNGDAYTFHYPFDVPGLPWRVFLWRVTTENGSVSYTEGRVPVEAMLSKLSELSAKAEEFGLLYRRALKAPEDMGGKMIVPLKKLRLGKVMGFDDDGIPVCGLKNIREAKEFLDEMNRILDEAKAVLEELKARAQQALEDLRALGDAIEGEMNALAEELKAALSALCEDLDRSLRELHAELESSLRATCGALADSLRSLAEELEGDLGEEAERLIGEIRSVGSEISEGLNSLFDDLKASLSAQAEAAREAQEGAQQAREGAEAAQSASEAAQAICEALAEELRNLGSSVDTTYSSILEIQTHLEALYAELTKYRYEVLTREEYEAKKAAGKLENDVIYFVKGTVAINDTLERLEEALNSLSASFAEMSQKHDEDVSELEGLIQATSDALDAAFAEASAALEALEGKHDTELRVATENLEALSATLASAGASIDALKSKDEEHAAGISANAEGVATNAADIAALQSSVAEKAEALRALIDALTTQVGEGDSANNAVSQGLLERVSAVEEKNEEQDVGIGDNADEIEALKARIAELVDGDIPALLAVYTQAIEDLQAASGVATATFSGTSKLSTADVMGVNDATVGHDANGALRVRSAGASANGTVYLPEREWSELENAAASLKLLRTKANAMSGGMEADSTSADGSAYGYLGPLSDLGVSGSSVDINTVTLYRNNGTVSAGQVYLRLLRKVTDTDGNLAWQIVSQSENAVDFQAQTENGGAIPTFYMRTQSGVEPLSTTETVALCVVSASDAEPGACVRRACKMRTDVSGCLANLLVSAAIGMNRGGAAYAPIAKFTWTPVAKEYGAATTEEAGVVQLAESLDDENAGSRVPTAAQVAVAIALLASRVAALEEAAASGGGDSGDGGDAGDSGGTSEGTEVTEVTEGTEGTGGTEG